MRHTENRRPQVPVMVGLGVAVWVVLATAFATARHGYYVPAAIEIGVLILIAVLFCSNAARHAARKR